jgi:hypothetical protein
VAGPQVLRTHPERSLLAFFTRQSPKQTGVNRSSNLQKEVRLTSDGNVRDVPKKFSLC